MMDQKEGYRHERLYPPRGSVYGMRFMYVDKDLQLIGKWMESWVTGENKARCRADAGMLHDERKVPYRGCPSGCGIWAAWKGFEQEPQAAAPQVVCLVEGYGKLIGGDLGWCAEKARLVAVSPAFYAYGWPPGEGVTWTLSSDSRREADPRTLCTTLDLTGLGRATGHRYGVPVLDRENLSDMSRALNHDWRSELSPR
jgi:hypothetical protein